MVRRTVLGLILVLALAAVDRAQNAEWHQPFPPLKIAGNLYYVGTADLAVYLITTPQGNILINTDFKQDLPLVKAGIEKLGFRYADTKILLISHAHADHDEATGVVQSETAAKLMVMDGDVPQENRHAHVDRVLHDGDTVELGGTKLVAHLTPGHTPGCTTWTMQVTDAGRPLSVVIVGSPNVNSGYILVGNKEYPQIANDYVKTFAVLKSLPCDIFLGAHGGYFGLLAKYDKLKSGSANPFVDPQGYQAYVAERSATFEKEWHRQQQNPGSPAP